MYACMYDVCAYLQCDMCGLQTVCECWHAKLIDEHIQPLACGKLSAVVPIPSYHGSQQLVELVVDHLRGGAGGATLLPRLNNHSHSEEQHAL